MTGAQPAGGPRPALRGLLSRDGRRVAPLIIGALTLALFVWWTAYEGGYAPGAWYPGALLFLVALVAIVRPGDFRRMPAPTRWALLLLAAYTAWSFLSIAWADARGDAWDGANRTLLYLTVFALFAALQWKRTEAAAFLAGFALATAGAGAWEIVRAIAGNAEAVFPDGRLAAPIDYENATAALCLAAFWPAVLLAARRSTPWLARGVLLAAAGVLLQLCILAQSRGSLIAGPVTLAVAVALTRDRGRLLLALTAIAVTTLAALPALLAVYRDAPPPESGTLVPAGIAIALSAAVLLAAGLASESLDRRWHTGLSRWIAAAAAAALATAGVAVAVARPDAGSAAPGSRFTAGVDTGRYDFWRVAARQLARDPVLGAGADNFGHDYERERRHGDENPLYPHSIIMRTIGQTGIVGAALLIGFLVAAGLALKQLGREAVAIAAFVSAAAWLAHGTIDWLWELPALAAPAMACLGLLAGMSIAAGAEREPPRAVRLRRGLALAVAFAAAVSYALPALAAREIERAVRGFDADPSAALSGLDRARRLNPLSDRADVIGGALALASGDRRRARRSFERALGRDGQNWYPEAELGLLDLREGRQSSAAARLARAHRMNPLEPSIGAALSAAERGAQAPPGVGERVSQLTVFGPVGRRPVSCLPVLGIASACSRRAGA
jgi:O-antigen ligase